MAKARDDGQRIINGLDEALAWAKGETSATILIPGQPARVMTRQEYEDGRAEIARLEQKFGVKGTAVVFREAIARAKAAVSEVRPQSEDDEGGERE